MLDKIYQKTPDFVSRLITEEEIILIPIGKKMADLIKIYNLQNETAVRFWMLIDKKKRLGEIIDILLNEYRIPRKRLITDLREFISKLEFIGAIKELKEQ